MRSRKLSFTIILSALLLMSPAIPTSAVAGGATTCGDADGSGNVSAGDALKALQAAVGSGACDLCRCDFNGSGGVSSADALQILRFAVAISVPPQCPSCFTLCADATLTDEQIENAAAEAVSGRDDPWGADFGEVIEEMYELLDCHPSVEEEAQAQPRGATSDCLRTYCSNANYCGAPSNSVTAESSTYFPHVSSCINQACFQHDLDSFRACISGRENYLGEETGLPDCFFSDQSAEVDAPFLDAFDDCQLNWGDRFLRAIVEALRSLPKDGDCECEACYQGASCSSSEGYCDSTEGTCTADCQFVGGAWDVSESAELCCSFNGSGQECIPLEGEGRVHLTQNACAISYVVPDSGGVQRSGTVNGDSVTLSGPIALLAPGATATKNLLTLKGEYAGQTMDLSGTGVLDYRFEGDRYSCTAESTALFERP